MPAACWPAPSARIPPTSASGCCWPVWRPQSRTAPTASSVRRPWRLRTRRSRMRAHGWPTAGQLRRQPLSMRRRRRQTMRRRKNPPALAAPALADAAADLRAIAPVTSRRWFWPAVVAAVVVLAIVLALIGALLLPGWLATDRPLPSAKRRLRPGCGQRGAGAVSAAAQAVDADPGDPGAGANGANPLPAAVAPATPTVGPVRALGKAVLEEASGPTPARWTPTPTPPPTPTPAPTATPSPTLLPTFVAEARNNVAHAARCQPQ